VSRSAHLLVATMTLSSVMFIVRLLRRHQLPAKYALLWLSAGMVLVALAAFPRMLDRVSARIGIAYAPATFFLGAVSLLFLVVIHFSWELSRLERRTRVLAEEMAILRADSGVDPAPDAAP